MKLRFYKIFPFVFLLNLACVQGQNSLQMQLNYADSIYNSADFFDAVTEYKRLMFFDTSGIYNYYGNFKIGSSYKKGAKFEEAIKYLTLASINAETIEEEYTSKLEIVRVNILRKSTDRALNLLDEIEKKYPQFADSSDINYWRGWAFMFADKWDEASASFAAIDSLHPLKKVADEVVNEKYSVTFAKVISYILPGSGQFYTGNYLSGIMSLGWNVLWGYLTIKAFAAERVFDGVIIGTLLWLRFYRGNYENAEKFAVEKNIDIANKALSYLYNNYNGIKP